MGWIQNTLSSMPIYFMSLLRIPRIVGLKLKKIQRDFFWSSDALEWRPHSVNWAIVCTTKHGRVLG